MYILIVNNLLDCCKPKNTVVGSDNWKTTPSIKFFWRSKIIIVSIFLALHVPVLGPIVAPPTVLLPACAVGAVVLSGGRYLGSPGPCALGCPMRP